MNIFLKKNGKTKSTLSISCFFANIIFILVYIVLYKILTEPLYQNIMFSDITLSNILHSIIISIIGTIICCLLFLLKDKRIVPYSFLSSLIFLMVLCGSILFLNIPKIIISVILLYAFIPIIFGNIFSWAIYIKKFRKK